MISINLYEIVFQIINFVLLLWLLNKFATKPLSNFLQKRAQSIQNDLEVAEQNKAESDKILAEQKELLKEAHQESQEIRKKAEDSAKKELNSVLVKAKADSAQIIENSKKDIELEYKRAQKSLTEQAATLSIKISEKLLKKQISEDDQQQLIQEMSTQS